MEKTRAEEIIELIPMLPEREREMILEEISLMVKNSVRKSTLRVLDELEEEHGGDSLEAAEAFRVMRTCVEIAFGNEDAEGVPFADAEKPSCEGG